jgi:YVTN family beta-propeller protein
MTAARYPDPAFRALTVTAGHTESLQLATKSGPDPRFDPPYAQMMYLRVAMLSGTAAPTLSLSTGSGAPVALTADPIGIFNQPGDIGYVGDVSVKRQMPGVFDVTIGLVHPESATAWRLDIRNTDTVDRLFTAVVADTEPGLDDPWVTPAPVTYQTSPALAVGGSPRHIAVDPDRHVCYIANYGDNTVSILDVAGRSISAPALAVGQHPFKVAVHPDAHTAYVANSEASTISVIDTEHLTATTPVTDAGDVVALAVDTDRGLLYAGCHAVLGGAVQGVLHRIATTDFSRQPPIVLPHRPFDVAIDPRRRLLYATDMEATVVSVVDLDTGQVHGIDVGKATFGVAVDTLTGAAYFSCPNDDIVLMVEPVSRTVTALATAATPVYLAVDPVLSTLLAANRADGTVGIIDLRSGATQSVPVGELPSGIAIDPASHVAVAVTAKSLTATFLEPHRG